MDERKMLDMIKKSGKNVDAPEEIKPEQIRSLLGRTADRQKETVSKICPVGSSGSRFCDGDYRGRDRTYQIIRYAWKR